MSWIWNSLKAKLSSKFIKYVAIIITSETIITVKSIFQKKKNHESVDLWCAVSKITPNFYKLCEVHRGGHFLLRVGVEKI